MPLPTAALRTIQLGRKQAARGQDVALRGGQRLAPVTASAGQSHSGCQETSGDREMLLPPWGW